MTEGIFCIFGALTVSVVVPYIGVMEQLNAIETQLFTARSTRVILAVVGFELLKSPYVTVFEKKDGSRGKQFFWYYRSI